MIIWEKNMSYSFFILRILHLYAPRNSTHFSKKLKEFEEKNAVGSSVYRFIRIALEMAADSKNDGGIQGVTYPIVADHSLTISMAYDVLAGELYDR